MTPFILILASFPSIVSGILVPAFLKLQFMDNKLELKHGRECLDTIGRAVISSIYNRSEICRSELFEILNSVDQFVLESKHAAVYKKLFAAAKLIAHQGDQKWFRDMKECQWHNTDDMIEITDSINHIPLQYTGVNKLKQLVKSLQMLSSCSVYSPKKECTRHSSAIKEIPREAVGTTLITQSSVQHESGVENAAQMSETPLSREIKSDLIIGADNLIERLQMALMFSLSLSVAQTPAGTSRWHAESVFISAMVRDEDWLMGVEGYALATLQTALL